MSTPDLSPEKSALLSKASKPKNCLIFERLSNDLLQEVFDNIKEFQENISTARVTPPIFPTSLSIQNLPENGTSLKEIYQLFKTDIQPYLSVSRSPRNFSFVTGGITPAALIGEFLVPIFDQNVMASASTARSIAPIIEDIVINMLCHLFRLEEFTGTLTTGATMSNLVGVLCARQWIGMQEGRDIVQDGLVGMGPIEIYSTCSHTSVLKVLGIAGLGRKIIEVKGLSYASTVMDPEDLEQCMIKSYQNGNSVAGRIVIGAAGEVNTGSFDEFTVISKIAKKYNAWFHIDGAFGLFAQCSPKYSHLTQGVEMADSVTCDGHKWLNVGYECGLFFIHGRHKQLLTSVFSTTAAYLPGNNAPMNRSLENSKRFRALPIWMSLKTLGANGYAEIVERNCQFAKRFGDWLENSQEFVLMAKVTLNVTLFRAKDNIDTTILLDRINNTGIVFFTGTVLDGIPGIRCAVCNYQTVDSDFDLLVQALQIALRTN